MTDRINPQGGNNLDITQAKARAVETTKRNEATADEKQMEATHDDVHLTNTATSLKRIEARLAEMPEVDESRVREVRARLESGSYEIKHEQLAEKMLRLDQSFS